MNDNVCPTCHREIPGQKKQMKIALQLCSLMKGCHIQNKQMAADLGVSVQTVKSWRYGTANPMPENRAKIEAIYRVTFIEDCDYENNLKAL